MGGSNTVPYVQGQLSGQPGVYGTLGTPAPGNTPGWRTYPVGWADNNGNLWLFGGLTFTPQQFNSLNDLWKFDTATGQWTWMNGSSSPGSNCVAGLNIPSCGRSGAYGTMGTPAAGNTPGGRANAAAWVDSSGNFWLYGGDGFDAAGNPGALSDLWSFNPSTNQWTWMGGSSTVPANPGCNCTLGQLPVPGTLGIAAQGNTPGALWQASSWIDKNGNFWLFGGWGYTPSGYASVPNDQWEFNPSSSEWAWMGGDSNFGTSALHGTYGDPGKFAAGNIPGPRWDTATWTDANGNLWLFGGQGDAAIVTEGVLNDLWEFNPSTNQWAWMGGSSTVNQPGVYGTVGVPAAGNIPGSRMDPFHWRDVNGNLWLFGGLGYDSNSNWNTLNDLWKFNPSTNQWAWMGGLNTLTNVPTGAGVYGTLGTPAPGNQPGRRSGGVSWTDKRGNFWLWGGTGLDANFTYGYLNDLWVYQLASPDFTISGTPVSIVAGATTGNTSTITATPTAGFTGNVILTAALTTSPSGALVLPTFSFNSTSPVSITGNAAGAATLTIVTTASSSPTCTSSNQMPSGIPWHAASAAALAGLFLFVIPIPILKRSRTWRSMLSLVLSFTALVGGAVGCSGGGRQVACPNVIKAGTTAGTYIITVTAISGAITRTGTVSVTVQ
jgi:N-acetylneuraminic acid mutarotase